MDPLRAAPGADIVLRDAGIAAEHAVLRVSARSIDLHATGGEVRAGEETVANGFGCALQMPIDRRVFGRDLRILTERLVRTAHRHGKQVHIWTVDDEAQIERLLDAGVDGIFTDRPDTLKTVLQRRGRWTEDPS